MKKIAVFFNVCLLCVVVWIFVKLGVPDKGNKIWIILFPSILAPILSLIDIFFSFNGRVKS